MKLVTEQRLREIGELANCPSACYPISQDVIDLVYTVRVLKEHLERVLPYTIYEENENGLIQEIQDTYECLEQLRQPAPVQP